MLKKWELAQRTMHSKKHYLTLKVKGVHSNFECTRRTE